MSGSSYVFLFHHCTRPYVSREVNLYCVLPCGQGLATHCDALDMDFTSTLRFHEGLARRTTLFPISLS